MARRSLATRLLARLVLLMVAATGYSLAAFAQTTQFTYQGKLTDSGSLAGGPYDFQFKLYDTVTLGTGIQQGSTLTLTGVAVTNGIFTVQLDFGTCPSCFNGADRFLEIAVKLTSGSTFTTLGPRQPITSTPYALKSLNAAVADGLSVACVNCVTSSQIGSVNGSAIAGTIPPASLPPDSASYIQNTTSQQASSNFNISGIGAIGGSLGIGTTSPMGKLQVVTANDTNPGSIFAWDARHFVVGNSASNGGIGMSYDQTNNVGYIEALTPSVAWRNLILQQGGGNVGIGTNSPSERLEVGGNVRVYPSSGPGSLAFRNRTNADYSQVVFLDDANTYRGFLGYIGANASLGNRNDTVEFGSNGKAITFLPNNNEIMRLSTNGNIGIGTTTPGFRLDVGDRMRVRSGPAGSAGIWFFQAPENDRAFVGLFDATQVGVYTPDSGGRWGLLVQDGEVKLPNVFGSGGASVTPLCRIDSDGRVSFCSSSLRYKTALLPFIGGLDIINRLKPITFAWKQDGKRDVGLGAEDVADVEPLLTFKNAQGEIEGVKYDRLSVVFINAFKQQQAQIRNQNDQIRRLENKAAQTQKQMRRQQDELASIKQLVCLRYPKAATCKTMSNAR